MFIRWKISKREKFGSKQKQMKTCWYSTIKLAHYIERHDAPIHFKLDCLFDNLFRHVCERKPLMTGGLPSQGAINAEIISISKRRRAYHVLLETPSFQRCHLCQTNDSQGHRFSRLLPREPSSLCRYCQRVDQIQPKYGGKMCSKVQNCSKVLYEMRLSVATFNNMV